MPLTTLFSCSVQTSDRCFIVQSSTSEWTKNQLLAEFSQQPNCKNASLPLSFALGWKLDPSWILQLGNRVQRCNALYVDVSGHGVCWSSLCALVSQYVMSHRSLLKRLLKNHIIYRHLRYLLFTLYEFLSISLHPFFTLSHHLFRSSFYCGLFNLFPKVGRFVKPRRPWACAKVSQTRPWVVECQCFGPKLLKHVFSAFFFASLVSLYHFFLGFHNVTQQASCSNPYFRETSLHLFNSLHHLFILFCPTVSVFYFLSKLGLGHTVSILVQRDIESLRCLWLETLRCKSIEDLMSIGWLKRSESRLSS